MENGNENEPQTSGFRKVFRIALVSAALLLLMLFVLLGFAVLTVYCLLRGIDYATEGRLIYSALWGAGFWLLALGQLQGLILIATNWRYK